MAGEPMFVRHFYLGGTDAAKNCFLKMLSE
jgi:hypothetical protein